MNCKVSDFVITDVIIWSGTGPMPSRKTLFFRNGEVSEIKKEMIPPSAKIIDGNGKYLIPGLVDMHVHFREPGFSYKETIETGTMAALRGGFTTVCTMPNLNPVPDSPETLRLQTDIIERDALTDVLPYASITRGRLGKELTDYASLAPYVAGFSDDGSGVQDEGIMRRAMKGIAPTGKILAAHCEVDSLLDGGYVHKSPLLTVRGHKGICSESEWREIERDIRLAEETGCRLHICHISTKEGVELVRDAKRRGVKVTCETAPHYLVFCDEDVEEDGRFKMNPPLRERADLQALRRGVADGTIDVIATDHAPHSAEEKAKGLARSAMGVVGLETALAAVYTAMVRPGFISLERMVELMAFKPAEILGIKPQYPLDATLVDFEADADTDPEHFLSKGKSTPFAGMLLKGKISATVKSGICYKF